MLEPVDPTIAPFLEVLPDDLVVNADTLAALRASPLTLDHRQPPATVTITDHAVDPDHGVILRTYRPADAASPAACLYWIHGGGYVLGSYDAADGALAGWADALGCVVTSVEYRLAPEHPYPAALDDCYTGLAWLHGHAAELGIDADRIGIGGISAGGGLAATLTLRARDQGELPVAFALLECPMLDDRQTTASSQEPGLVVWSRESNTFGWRSYLGDLYGTDRVPGHAAAARAADLRGLPPTYVIVGGVDGFRDEDIAYATRLAGAGVPTELHVMPGLVHGATSIPGLPVTDAALALTHAWLARQVAAPVEVVHRTQR